MVIATQLGMSKSDVFREALWLWIRHKMGMR